MNFTKKNGRKVVAAGSAAFCAALVTAGFIAANYNTTKMGSGSAELRTDIYISDGSVTAEFMGEQHTFTPPAEAVRAARKGFMLLPPAWQLAGRLFEALSDMTD